MLEPYSLFPLLSPLLLALLGGGQLGLWFMWRQYAELAWLGVGLSLFALALGVQLLWRDAPLLPWIAVPAAGYVLGAACQFKALALRWRVPYAIGWALAVGGAVLLAQVWFTMGQPSLRMRILTLNGASYLLAGLTLMHWRRLQLHNRFDRALRVMLLVTLGMWVVCGYVLLPLSLQEMAHPHEFTKTVYWFGAHLTAMVSSMLLAGVMFFAVLHDVLYRLDSERQLDPLTQMLNRRGFQEQLLRQVQRNPGWTWTVLVCDVDYFKRINDSWGHEAGDRVLQNLACSLRQQLRSSDLLARFGGEEFVIVLAQANELHGVQVAERIRQHVAQHVWLPDRSGTVTISVGVAMAPSSSVAGVEQAIQRADVQLYCAKATGRNCVQAQALCI